MQLLDLFHCYSTVDPNEKRRSMVIRLLLYKAEAVQGNEERGGKGMRREGEQEGKRERELSSICCDLTLIRADLLQGTLYLPHRTQKERRELSLS